MGRAAMAKAGVMRRGPVEVAAGDGLAILRGWLAARGWRPAKFQVRAWAAHRRGESGLINVPTGAGKTYGAYFGPLAELIRERTQGPVEGLRILFVTPLRAMSRDIELALRAPIEELGLRIKVESRTGDTSTAIRTRQRTELPPVLITTPESLSLMLTRENAAALFSGLRTVIVDEWHELLSSKRGTQTELALARLRRLAPSVKTWALSATLANLDEAARGAVGVAAEPPTIIRGEVSRRVEIRTLVPADPQSMPWAGHLGLKLLEDVVAALDPSVSTLVFANTRSQAELWYGAIKFRHPDWSGAMGLHHGSIDRAERERVERGLKSGEVRLVVCTSSLDLGVDFAPVQRVVQIGSPKGIARLLQRAGRSGHRPGAPCEILCVPTQWIELIEVAAVRRAVGEGVIEPRVPLNKPLDALAQHLVTCALGGGFSPDALYEEVRGAWAYRDLTRSEFDWALALVCHGGGTLRAYPEYNKVVEVRGMHRVENPRIAQLHRLNLGTITSDATLDLRYASGRRLGSIEEAFIAQLRPGTKFFFAGKTLEFVRLTDTEAIVRAARGRSTFTPHWSGTRLPISESLSEEMRLVLGDLGGSVRDPEIAAAAPYLQAQARYSQVPGQHELLVELCRTREGYHCCLFPFEGRLVNAGIAAILALRLARRVPVTLSLAANDYGLELLAAHEYPFEEMIEPGIFTAERLAEDAMESAAVSTLARRQFREIARVAGLVFQTYPGARKSGRQIQTSTSLLFDVFTEFDPGNLLLEQARREVLERHFEQSRLARTMRRLAGCSLRVVTTDRPTPLSFPLMVERIGANITTENLAARIDRMRGEWEMA